MNGTERDLPGIGTIHADALRCSHVKRFLERWTADATFRDEMPRAPVETLRARGLTVDPEEVRPIWDGSLHARSLAGSLNEAQLPESLRLFRAHIANLVRWRDALRAAAPAHPRWRAWRERQLARTTSEMGKAWAQSIVFSPACYELSKGCSVGCWFCGIAAPRLSAVLHRTPDSARLFRGTVEAVAELTGSAAMASQFLYWASDPFDNPDFEAYSDDFLSVTGHFPTMTTALSLRDPDRTRRWLQGAHRRGLPVTRFSVLSLAMLERIHRTFTAEEMADVECVLLSDNSLLAKANAGRFRERATRDRKVLENELEKVKPVVGTPLDQVEPFAPSSIACVSGFLFNMVERTVQLIAPCRASERWPLGYVVLSRGRFDDVAAVRQLLVAMIDEHMLAAVPEDVPVAFRDDLRYGREGDAFRLWNCNGGLRFASRAGYMGGLGDLVAAACHRPAEIEKRLLRERGVEPADTRRALHGMFERGILNEWTGQTGGGAAIEGSP